MRSHYKVSFGFLLFTILLCSLNVSAQLLDVNPAYLSFTYQVGGPNPPAQNLFVTGPAGSSFSVDASGTPWLTVQPLSGVVPSTLVVTAVPPANATPGTLTGNIIIGPPASTSATKLVVPVTFQILQGKGQIFVSPNSLTFGYVQGTTPPASQGVMVTSPDSPAYFSTAVSTSNGLPWLAVSPTSGQTPLTAQVYVLPTASMGPGTYTGTVLFIPGASGATVQKVAVTLQVSSSGALTATPNTVNFIYELGGTKPVAQTVTITNSGNGAATPFNVSAAYSNGGSWFTYSPLSATTPATIVVSLSPNAYSLPSGTYFGTLTFTATLSGASATQIPLSLTIYSTSQLVVSPANIIFDYAFGNPLPAEQYVSVTATGSPIPFVVSVNAPSWITAAPAAATTPSAVAIGINPPSGTPAGSYTGTVLITPVSGGNLATISVTARISSPNNLTLGRNQVNFNYSLGGSFPPVEIIPVTTSAASLFYSVVSSTYGGGHWLFAAQSTTYTPGNVTLSVNPAGLAAGTYYGVVNVIADGANNSPQTINVTLVVSTSPSFTATPLGMVFAYQIGGGLPPVQSAVLTYPHSTTEFTVTPSTQSGVPWLIAAQSSLTAPATIAAGIDPTGLVPGVYSGTITVKSNDGSVAPLEMPVILNVSYGSLFFPQANQVSFQYQQNGPIPAAQTVGISSLDQASIVFYPTVQTADGGQWLKVAPASSVTSLTSAISITVAPQGLAPGVYQGVIGIFDAAGIVPPSYVPVSLQVTAGEVLTVPFQTLRFDSQYLGAPPSPLQITVRGTGRVSSFRVTTSMPNVLQVSPDSGVTDATITVTANPGTLAPGFYLGTITIDIPGVDGSAQVLPVDVVVSGF